MNQEERFTLLKDRISKIRKARDHYLHAFLKDPMARLLTKRLHLSPLKAYLLGLSFVLFTYAVRLVIFSSLQEGFAGLQRIRIDFIYDLLLVPLTYGYYIWISTSPAYLTLKMSMDGMFKSDSAGSLEHFHTRNLNHPYVFRIAACASLVLMILHLPKIREGAWIWIDHPADISALFLLKIPLTWIIPWYMASIILIKQSLMIFHFRKLYLSSRLQINLFHKDRCGGLKGFSDYLLRFSFYLMFCAFGIVLLTLRGLYFDYFRRDYLVHAAMILYVPLALFYFYFPLQPLHLRMKKAAEEIKQKVREQFPLPRFAFTMQTQRYFLLALFSPVLLFFLVCLL